MRRSNGLRRAPSKKAGGARESANTKRNGEISEAAFLHKAVSLGFKVTKPWGDSERYDFVVDSGKRLWRVQVKCTSALHAGGYHIQPIHYVYGKKKVVYTAEEIDVLAAHVVPLNVWYLVPVPSAGAGDEFDAVSGGRMRAGAV
jgi:long-subunit fatty acid transport protein